MGTESAKKKPDSKVPFDISRAPLGLRAASALVTELSKLDDRFERHYLEIKSEINPSKNELAKIAKFILGSANRMPEKAATAFEGYGVMVIGVSPGKITGVPPIEILEIDKVVGSYTGPHGPQWDLIHVPVTDSKNSVLVILVDPPQNGQHAFVCRKDGDGLANGRIYIRADGETREARADEVDRILERGKRSAASEVGFEVEVIGPAYPVTIDEQRTVDIHIATTVARLLAALPQPETEPEPEEARSSAIIEVSESQNPPSRSAVTEVGKLSASSAAALSEPFRSSLAARAAMADALKPHQNAMAKMAAEVVNVRTSGVINALLTTDPEKRTEEQYRRAIEQWAQVFREAWPAAVETLTAYSVEAISIRVSNKAKIFFTDLELKIHLEGEVDGIEWVDGGENVRLDQLGLREPPRKWGPTQRSIIGNDFFASQFIPSINLGAGYRSPLGWKNGGSVDITLKVGKLRPHGEHLFDDPELILVLPNTSQNQIKGTWQITASGHDEIYEGELHVEVNALIDLTGSMRSLLKLDAS